MGTRREALGGKTVTKVGASVRVRVHVRVLPPTRREAERARGNLSHRDKVGF